MAYEGGNLDVIPSKAVLLQEILRENGYTTLGVTGGGNAGKKFGFARGFDEFNDRSRSIKAGSKRILRMISDHMEDGKPIFAFLHTYEVHSPYFPPREYRSLYGTFDSDYEPSSENLIKNANTAHEDLAPEDLDHIRAMYDAGIRFTDDQLRELFGQLEVSGFLADAVVVVTSDHGEELGERGGLLHRGLLYEELLAVPLIFSGSRVPEGLKGNLQASSVDIAPTLLAAAGIPVPSHMQGRPLFLPDGSAGRPVDYVVSQYGKEKYSVRTSEWKYIESTDPPKAELYRLSKDAGEKNDLSAAEPELVRELHRYLLSWKEGRTAVEQDTGGPAADLSEEEKARLKALGYLGDG